MVPERRVGRRRPFVVAIDGPAGVGKSTLAGTLAQRLELPYVNTGLMYRALARRALDAGLDPSDGVALAELAETMVFELSAGPAAIPPSLVIDHGRPAPELVSPEVEAIVSTVARHPEVRAVLRARQRALTEGGAVIEGRDIGSVVVPDADVKLFLGASSDVRAGRRSRERPGQADVAEAVTLRDTLDARTNPFVPAEDAVVIDTSGLSRDDVLARAQVVIAARMERPLTSGAAAHGDDGGRRASRRTRPPRVAVVGRQNVGKSTLVNRLLGRKIAIAHEEAGVTRDRIDVLVTWDGRSFVLVDTGGFVSRPRGIDAAVVEQAATAARSADIVVLVVDAQTGVQEEDAILTRRLRSLTVPIVVVANKVDSERQEPLAAAFYGLGLGEPLPVSALHGRGSGELLDRMVELLPELAEPQVEGEEYRFCLVGRPNVGKSSLFNRLVQEERAVVHEQPGTTRDAIDTLVEIEGRNVRFVDTAGLRREVKTQGVEYFGLLRSRRAIEASHVVVLVIDAAQGLTAEDKRIAASVAEAGRGLVVALNKWDLVPSEDREDAFRRLGRQLALFPGTPVVRTSALRGTGVGRIVPALVSVHEAWARRVPTAEVNEVLQRALAAAPPPRGVGRIRYATQVSIGPPTFVLFGARTPPAPYRRYLENTLRRSFGFDGVPLRLVFRAKESRPGDSRTGPDRARHRSHHGRST
jgi:GTP-binding protein